jgi:hypothetical protein
MELVDSLDQTLEIRNDPPGRGVKPFIFNRALLPSSAKLRMIMSTAPVSMGYREF